MFLITGLPRSRTAWLANLLTTRETLCHHEGLIEARNKSEYEAMLYSDTATVGDANTILALPCYSEVLELTTKVVVIHRKIEEVIRSSEVFLGASLEGKVQVFEEQSYRLGKIRGLHINFEDINQRIQEIWEYCTPEPFSRVRTNKLMQLNVQTMNKKYNLSNLWSTT